MILRPKFKAKMPIEAECISPDILAEKKIEDLEVYQGNKRRKLSDLFEILDVKTKDVRIEGDVGNVKYIGAKMRSGKIIIDGNAGMHLGSEMEGGEIFVEGDAGDWVGAEMRGGLIRIKGNAGNLVGAAYRGSKVGMRQGMIIVEGDAGHEIGERMKRGIIAILGDVASFAGAHMKGGTILCFGNMGERTGAEMDRGTIIAFNPLQLLPTFRYNATYNPVFLRFCLRELRKYDLPIADEHITGRYERYNGDLTELGKGEILVWKG
ncbi:MAG: formylmethanofuran dehydrogenase subunit C [Methanocellales archaeon]|nr:formylmethanofuran dehydrogenase subunit C [Methanocellales archaeon]